MLLSSHCVLCRTALRASVVPQWTMLWWRLWGDIHTLQCIRVWVVYPCTLVVWCRIMWSLCNADNRYVYWWATRHGFMHIGGLVWCGECYIYIWWLQIVGFFFAAVDVVLIVCVVGGLQLMHWGGLFLCGRLFDIWFLGATVLCPFFVFFLVMWFTSKYITTI